MGEDDIDRAMLAAEMMKDLEQEELGQGYDGSSQKYSSGDKYG